MIRVICETLKGLLTNMDYVERLGGVVMPVTQEVVNEEGVPTRYVFPITCDAEGTACVESGKYFDMLPNDAYKSVLYFEDRTGVAFGAWQRKYNEQTFRGVVRLVGWLNLAKMGFDSCSVTDRIVMAIIQSLHSTKPLPITVTETGWTGAQLDVEKVDLVRRGENLFAQYTWAQTQQAIIYPFDTFGMDITFTLKTGVDCVDAPALESEILCK